jgi:hypothetical protein
VVEQSDIDQKVVTSVTFRPAKTKGEHLVGTKFDVRVEPALNVAVVN